MDYLILISIIAIWIALYVYNNHPHLLGIEPKVVMPKIDDLGGLKSK